MALTIYLLCKKYGELLIMPANGRWDLTQRLKGYKTNKVLHRQVKQDMNYISKMNKFSDNHHFFINYTSSVMRYQLFCMFKISHRFFFN
jgi:hypothetical protein